MKETTSRHALTHAPKKILRALLATAHELRQRPAPKCQQQLVRSNREAGGIERLFALRVSSFVRYGGALSSERAICGCVIYRALFFLRPSVCCSVRVTIAASEQASETKACPKICHSLTREDRIRLADRPRLLAANQFKEGAKGYQ